MTYKNIIKAQFIKRPNRFIAKVFLDGAEIDVHVKNTGRCKELLVEGRTVYLEPATSPNRKTPYSLVAVEKEGLLVNMDSQAPNQVVYEALDQNLIPGIKAQNMKREVQYGSSRFDIAFYQNDKKCFMEVKGVTLEENGYCKFPDAPTERGLKHVTELIKAKTEGYEAYIFFLIQMAGMKQFSPNNETDSAFSKALKKASSAGVHILVYDSILTIDSIAVSKEVPLVFE